MVSGVGAACAGQACRPKSRRRLTAPSADEPKESVVFMMHSYAPIKGPVQLEKDDLRFADSYASLFLKEVRVHGSRSGISATIAKSPRLYWSSARGSRRCPRQTTERTLHAPLDRPPQRRRSFQAAEG